jgi:hypothetical protein
MLKELILHDVGFSAHGLRDLARRLTVNRHLQCFHLTSTIECAAGLPALVEACQSHPALRRVGLSPLPAEDASALFAGSKSLLICSSYGYWRRFPQSEIRVERAVGEGKR